eukprot:677991-Lingulodinium_polyedra.AAC.1
MCIRDRRLQNAAQGCGRNNVPRPQRLARSTYAHSMRGPVFGPRVERVSVRFASRCDGQTSVRPRRCA